jgi:hypothetical protein
MRKKNRTAAKAREATKLAEKYGVDGPVTGDF